MQGTVAIDMRGRVVRLPLNCSIYVAKYSLSQVINTMKNMIHFRRQRRGKVGGSNKFLHIRLVPRDQAIQIFPDQFEAVVLVRNGYSVHLRILRGGLEAWPQAVLIRALNQYQARVWDKASP